MYGHSSNYETLVDNILNISKNIKIIVPNLVVLTGQFV